MLKRKGSALEENSALARLEEPLSEIASAIFGRELKAVFAPFALSEPSPDSLQCYSIETGTGQRFNICLPRSSAGLESSLIKAFSLFRLSEALCGKARILAERVPGEGTKPYALYDSEGHAGFMYLGGEAV